MEILSPSKPPRKVFDYDFMFVHGVALPLTIDPEAGDTIDFEGTPGCIKIYLAAKPSNLDPSQHLPSEELTIIYDKLITFQKREREIRDLTWEERAELQKAWDVQPSSKTH